MNTRVWQLFTVVCQGEVSRVNERVHSGEKPLNANSLASVSVKEVLRDMGKSIPERRLTQCSRQLRSLRMQKNAVRMWQIVLEIK